MQKVHTTPHAFAGYAEAFRSGETSPLDVLDAALARIDAHERDIRAFVALNRDRARDEARASAARWREGKPLSAIDGMAVAIKDIIETRDMPTGQGSPMWTGFQSRRDAATVQALRQAGALIVGKTATTEFAVTELFASTTNPHDVTRTSGGSSAGSAAAVAAGFVPVALGTQVVGSIIRPASYCGCVGYKPSYGAINRGGSYDYLSHSCTGLIGATLDDVWTTARAIASRVGGDPGYPGLSGPERLPAAVNPKRLVMLQTGAWRDMSEPAWFALRRAISSLRERGIEVVTPDENEAVRRFDGLLCGDLHKLSMDIIAWESRWPLEGHIAEQPALISRAMHARAARAASMTSVEYATALNHRHALREAYRALMADYDATITLSAPAAAPVGFASTGHAGFAIPASLLGAPALSLPLLRDGSMPLGLQMIGHLDRDADLFGFAASVSGWLERTGAAA
jgi:Asp-tRNA(Asn)/Glu-tRNA(Gln) amidotransferase A subunit family amidase